MNAFRNSAFGFAFAVSLAGLMLAHSEQANALPISDLYNTGVDGSGAPLSGGVDDPNYSLITQPGSGLSDQTIVDDDFPIPPWVANDSNSRWIGVDGNADGDGPAGDYVYQTVFTLPGEADLSSVAINGLWSADNTGTDILINGTSTGQSTNGGNQAFEQLTPFSITDGFVSGTNTLDFAVTNATSVNGDNPTGLRVDNIQGSFETVPEPAALGLMGVGLVGIGFAARRRKTA